MASSKSGANRKSAALSGLAEVNGASTSNSFGFAEAYPRRWLCQKARISKHMPAWVIIVSVTIRGSNAAATAVAETGLAPAAAGVGYSLSKDAGGPQLADAQRTKNESGIGISGRPVAAGDRCVADDRRDVALEAPWKDVRAGAHAAEDGTDRHEPALEFHLRLVRAWRPILVGFQRLVKCSMQHDGCMPFVQRRQLACGHKVSSSKRQPHTWL
ncbi:hypothetical protein MPL1032_130108 [Mesorhizobium plurifarium]|uniref:Uncharacterized protein n=1 Tax=Mesorhizobium plurifarium TaxID=69974 RepID=A0A0K2VR28_MESPL|nr:hypothetical protein MPL1032_130108 [Mesorhizobium plurifarium]